MENRAGSSDFPFAIYQFSFFILTLCLRLPDGQRNSRLPGSQRNSRTRVWVEGVAGFANEK